MKYRWFLVPSVALGALVLSSLQTLAYMDDAGAPAAREAADLVVDRWYLDSVAASPSAPALSDQARDDWYRAR